MEHLVTVSLLLISIFIILLVSVTRKAINRRLPAGKLPPGPKNLPLIGCMHHLLRQLPAHRSLCYLSAAYGPIMYLRLGEIPTIIISSAEAASEILKTHDIHFATRPLTASIKTICYNGKGLIFAPHGDYWRQMRRICILELLSPKRVLRFRAIREEEVTLLVQSIATFAGGVVNLSDKLSSLTNNITARAAVGGKSADQKEFLSALGNVIERASGFTIVDLFPSLPNFIKRLASFQLKRSWLKLDKILEKIVQEHKAKKAIDRKEDEEDVTDVLLRIQQDGALQFPLSTDHVKAVINDMLMAGSETTSTTIEWAMSELVRNPNVLKKAQKEVTEAFDGSARKKKGEEELTSAKLSYLPLVIKETLRLHPPVPLLLPRENQDECEVMGYRIPAKSTVMVNVWAIGRNPAYWEMPEAFRPERFEEMDTDLKGTHFEFIPFGSGRRICPGIHFGWATVELTLAYLLYHFDWDNVSVAGDELDMSEALGVATRRKTPLCLRATPRDALSAHSPPFNEVFSERT